MTMQRPIYPSKPRNLAGEGLPGQLRTTSRAFSLLEVMVAFSILLLGLLPVLSVFSTTSRESQKTSEHSFGMSLATKVSEELHLSNWENPVWLDELESDPSFSGSLPIINGESPFFASLEDTKPPYGSIQSGEDPGIVPAVEPLYSKLKGFRMAVDCTSKTLPTTGSVMDAQVIFQWTTPEGRTTKVPLDVILGRFACRPSIPFSISDRAKADTLIRESFYPGATGASLSQAVASAGGDLDAVRAVGDLVILSLGLRDAAKVVREEGDILRKGLSGETEDSLNNLLKLGRLHERYASYFLNVMAYLQDPSTNVPNGFRSQQLGQTSASSSIYRTAIALFDDLPRDFVEHFRAAQVSYADAFNPPFGSLVRPRLRMRLFMKLIDLGKLGCLTQYPEFLPSLKSSLKSFLTTRRGRNPNFTRYVERELEICSSVDNIRSRDSTWRDQVWNKHAAAYTALMNRIR